LAEVLPGASVMPSGAFCARQLGVVDQAGLVELLQGEVAAALGALGIAPRVVPGRAADDADQQRDLLGAEVAQVAPEPELGAGGDAADLLRAALAQVDLVEVGLQDRALVVARLDQQRVQDLVELAGQGLFLADAEQAAARQLLRQGAGALLVLAARAHGDEQRAQHAGQVDAVVAVEVAVFHRLQAGDEELGDFLDAHDAALFLLLAVQRGDARRVEFRRLDRALARQVAHAGDAIAGQHYFHPARPDHAGHVLEAAAGDPPAAAVVAVGARAHAGAVVAVGRGVELGLERARVHRQSRRQQQRPRIDPRRQLPAQLAEVRAHLVVEVQGVGNQEAEPEPDRRQPPGQ
jgi:hypothetical protein